MSSIPTLSGTDARVVLVRHAETPWNAEGRWQGQADPPLSERGLRQAEALARDLADQGIEVLISSDLRRAAETAAIVAKELGLVPRYDARLRELDVGAWSGLLADEIQRRDPEDLARFRAGDPDVRAGGAETRSEIRQRARTAAAELARTHSGRCIALVTHLGVIRALLPGAEPANAQWCSAQAAELVPPEVDPRLG